jgi:radical SAM protein with 4Fe4S-binding SPASM domain
MLQDGLIPALRPEWVLRNERNKVICYLMATEECRYQVLNPQEALIAALLNGHDTVAKLVEAICYIARIESRGVGLRVLERVLRSLNTEEQKVELLEKPATAGNTYSALDFIVPPESFCGERRLSAPLTLLIYFSAACQANCRYCYADLSNMRRCRHLTIAQWSRILDEARRLDIRIIHLTGGDTLARPDSIDFLCALARKGFLFLVSTKCRVSQDDAARLADAGFNVPVNTVRRLFQVSVDSCDPKELRLLMGREGYLEQATGTVRSLLGAGIPVQVKAVLTPFNYRRVGELVDRFGELGVRHFRASLYSRSFYRHDDRLFMSDDMKREAASMLQALRHTRPELTIDGDATRLAGADNGMATEKQERWSMRTNCSAGRTNLGVAPDGRVVVCEQMPLTSPYVVGDLTRQSILDVWDSPQLRDLVMPPRSRFYGTPCYACDEFRACIHNKGTCFRDAYFAYGRLHHPPPKCPHAPPSSFRFV